MFEIALGLHPPEITNIFRRNPNFNRNLSYTIDKMPYIYLQRNAPYSLITNWNSLNLSIRAWLNEMPDPKICNSTAKQVNNNISLFDFKFNGFQKSVLDSYLQHYQDKVKCNSSYCSDCN